MKVHADLGKRCQRRPCLKSRMPDGRSVMQGEHPLRPSAETRHKGVTAEAETPVAATTVPCLSQRGERLAISRRRRCSSAELHASSGMIIRGPASVDNNTPKWGPAGYGIKMKSASSSSTTTGPAFEAEKNKGGFAIRDARQQ